MIDPSTDEGESSSEKNAADSECEAAEIELPMENTPSNSTGNTRDRERHGVNDEKTSDQTFLDGAACEAEFSEDENPKAATSKADKHNAENPGDDESTSKNKWGTASRSTMEDIIVFTGSFLKTGKSERGGNRFENPWVTAFDPQASRSWIAWQTSSNSAKQTASGMILSLLAVTSTFRNPFGPMSILENSMES